MTRLIGLATALLTASSAAAQQQCAPRDIVIDHLGQQFAETRQSIGLAQDNHVIETFASLETGTWTIVITTPQGVTCLVASGTGFERLDEALQPAGVQS